MFQCIIIHKNKTKKKKIAPTNEQIIEKHKMSKHYDLVQVLIDQKSLANMPHLI